MFIDNAGAYIPTDCKFFIRQEFAHRMKWILQNEDGTSSLGPNLICEIYTPSLLDLNASNIYEDVQLPGTSVSVMFAKCQGYYQLSRHAHWRFVNLNSAYHDMVLGKARTLFEYSDVCKRSVVGNQETDFLREVPFSPTGTENHYYEPVNERHLPVQRQLIETIEVQVAEDTGELATLSSGNTTVGLHFKQM